MGRTVVVGDIHGCFDELMELLEALALSDEDLLVSVGDLVDRGPKPVEVVEFFRARGNSVVVAGNHERKHVRGVFSYSQDVTRLQAGDGYAAMVEWMRTLPYYFENEHVRVVHAGMVPGIPLSEQPEEILCGSSRGERELAARFASGHWHDRYEDAEVIAFGHHVTGDEPMVRDGRIFGLDTGACHGGRLTALSLPDMTIHSVAAHTDHWSNVRRNWQLPVLRTKPWHGYTWLELAETITRLSATPDAASRAWLAEIEKWSVALQSVFPALVSAAERTADGLDAEKMKAHPASMFLFQARNNRLDVAGLSRQCNTPRRTIDLTVALGVEVPALPD
ncbi:metallophosphoesterase family protein [Nocardia sp. NBC_00511]|uniref:metallophosphoesterase family protein n=1 Tax=Nocardia sp. NBC_00511 TaxID=2903591 RepID=UPI0030E31C31